MALKLASIVLCHLLLSISFLLIAISTFASVIGRTIFALRPLGGLISYVEATCRSQSVILIWTARDIIEDGFEFPVGYSHGAALGLAKRAVCTIGAAIWTYIDESYQKRIYDDICNITERVYEVYEKNLNTTSFKLGQLISSVYCGWLSVLYDAVQQGFLANTGALLRLAGEGLCRIFNFLRGYGIWLLSSSLQQLCAVPNHATGAFCIFFNFLKGDVDFFARGLASSAFKEIDVLHLGRGLIESALKQIGRLASLAIERLCMYFSYHRGDVSDFRRYLDLHN